MVCHNDVVGISSFKSLVSTSGTSLRKNVSGVIFTKVDCFPCLLISIYRLALTVVSGVLPLLDHKSVSIIRLIISFEWRGIPASFNTCITAFLTFINNLNWDIFG